MDFGFTLRQLSYFVTAARTGSTAAAAQAEAISQSSMSSALSDLERGLGVQLMLRQRGKGLTLTRAGRALLPDARKLLRNAERLGLEARGRQGASAGRSVIGCFSAFAPLLVPRLVRYLGQRYPEIELDFVEGSHQDVRNALVTGETELALLSGVEDMTGLITDVLYTPVPHALLPADHRLATREQIALSELADDRFIYLDAHPSGLFYAEIFGSAEAMPIPRFTSSNVDHVRALVRFGLGYAVVVQRGRPVPERRSLSGVVAVPLVDAVSPQTIVLARVRGLHLTRLGQLVRQACLAELADPDGGRRR